MSMIQRDTVYAAVKIAVTATLTLLYSTIGGFSCDERMLQVHKNLSQANRE